MKTPVLEGRCYIPKLTFGSPETRGFRRKGGRDGTLHNTEHSLLASTALTKDSPRCVGSSDGKFVSLHIAPPLMAELLSLYVCYCILRPAKVFIETTPPFSRRIDPWSFI